MNSKIIAVAALATALSGCATIVSESKNPVSIASSPPQAAFTISDKAGVKLHSGTTPEVVVLESGSGYFSKGRYTIDYQKDGYQAKAMPLAADMNGWYIGNLLFGGLVGFLVVDPATGAMWKLPSRVEAVLDKRPSVVGEVR